MSDENEPPDQDPSQQNAWEAMADESSPQPHSPFRNPFDWYRERKRQKRAESKLHHELKQRQGRVTATSVIRYTKFIAVFSLCLSLFYTIFIFLVGMASIESGQIILSQIPGLNALVPEAPEQAQTAAQFHANGANSTPNGWSTYFLLALPATLTAVLGITVWVSGLRYAMSFYSDKEPNNQDDSLGTNSLLAEVLKRIPPQNNNP